MRRKTPFFLVLQFLLAAILLTSTVAQQLPVLHPIGRKTAMVGWQLSFEVSGTDPDGPPFLWMRNQPPGAEFVGLVANSNTRTGTFQWSPQSFQLGMHEVIFYAGDGVFTDSEVVEIEVRQADYDPGIRDTIKLVVTVQPEEATGQFTVVLDLYVFNDSTLIGATAGFSWENSNLLMDSAVATPLVDTGFEIGPFLYENNDINTTNANRRFLIGGSRQSAARGIPGSVGGRRLWATYYFSLTTWSATDSIVFDTTLVPPSDSLLFVAPDTTLLPQRQVDFVPNWTGKVVVKDVSDVTVIEGSTLPGTYSLSQNYPNPFNPITQINFEIPARSHVTLTVFNILGREVATLVDEELASNRYVVDWDGRSDGGNKVASGIYFYKLVADDFSETKKMLLLK